ncbi:helix-turn-helix domain-containing protein, partial [Salmonella enterica subsp. enterica serovar Panama]|uniref:helix-turn-helix domain-containing protein n=1 Tax=Salmonella enterica TaxID=28901 RepID=UPI00117B4841
MAIRLLCQWQPGGAAIGLYSFLAGHIDPTCGAVVAEQQFLADKLNVSRRTIKRWLNSLETKNAAVRIQVPGNVCAYALDPNGVWKGYNSRTGYPPSPSKTLTAGDGGFSAAG